MFNGVEWYNHLFGSGDVVKNISFLDLWRPSCLVERAIYAILKEGIMGNIHVKSYEIWTSGSAVHRFT